MVGDRAGMVKFWAARHREDDVKANVHGRDLVSREDFQ
jgi:hypothetical protein